MFFFKGGEGMYHALVETKELTSAVFEYKDTLSNMKVGQGIVLLRNFVFHHKQSLFWDSYDCTACLLVFGFK